MTGRVIFKQRVISVRDMGQLWDDPWIAVAAARDGTGGAGPWNTRFSPPVPVIPEGLQFQCVRWGDLTQNQQDAWAGLVGTRWLARALERRLEGAWLPVIWATATGDLMATCVLRPRSQQDSEANVWLLETLRARRGHGALLLRCLAHWIWSRSGPFVLGYTWELGLAGLAAAWWRGWLVTAAEIQYGWVLRRESDRACSFCSGSPVSWKEPRIQQPTLLQFGDVWAIVDDSGLCDSTGYVLAWRGDVPWNSVFVAGDWEKLWMRCSVRPTPKWHATGEIIVVGYLNSARSLSPVWITAEI